MSQPNVLFSQIGDWSWDLVEKACDIDVSNAKTEDGTGSYLSYIYIHLIGNRNFL